MSARFEVVQVADRELLAQHHDGMAARGRNPDFWEAKADNVRTSDGALEDVFSEWDTRADADEELARLRSVDLRPWVSYEVREVSR